MPMSELERIEAILAKVDPEAIQRATEHAYPTDKLTRARRILSCLPGAEVNKAIALAFPTPKPQTGGESAKHPSREAQSAGPGDVASVESVLNPKGV